MLTGKHLINGDWIAGGRVLEPAKVCEATPVQVDLAAQAAEAAFPRGG